MIAQASGFLSSPQLPSPAFLGAAALAILVALALALDIPRRWQLAGLFGLGVSLRLFIATRSPLIIQDWPLSDDSHYYFTIARNLANGYGLKHDSFHTTTGFQPLYLLLITPFELIQDKLLAINCILVFQAAIGVLCGVLLYRLARLVSTEAVATLAAGIWALSLVFVTADLNGLETNTALLLLLATVLFYLTHFGGPDLPDAWTHARLGLLCGVGFLARVDLGFLIAVLGLHLLARHRVWQMKRASLVAVAVFSVAAALPMLPWLVFNIFLTGSILPSSGQAVRFISLAYGYGILDPAGVPRRYFDVEQIPLEYYRLTLQRGWRDLTTNFGYAFPHLLGIATIAAALALSFRQVATQLRRVAVLLIFLVIAFFSYTGYIFGQWFFLRYLTPITVGYLVVLFICLAALAAKGADFGVRRLRLAGIALAAIVLGSAAYPTLQAIQSTLRASKTTELHQMAVWINTNTPPDAVIGAYQSGILGYYMERRFYGLDGKINVDALRALQSKTMDRYVRETGMDYLVDWDWILDDLYTRRSEEVEPLAKHRLLLTKPMYLYELSRPHPAPKGP